jgi:hypothetical protein
MRVACVKLLDTRGGEAETSTRLTLDSEYVGLSIGTDPLGGMWVRIIGDAGDGPGVWPTEMFLTVSTEVPSSWVASVGEGGLVDLAPPSWLRPGFWEDYFNGTRRPSRTSRRRRARSYVEAGVKI